MNTMSWIMIGIALVLAIGGAVYFYRSRKKSMDVMFNQVFETSRQIPNQKKQAYMLFMFKESILAAKAKTATSQSKMSNPKYIELQMIHMGTILKDRTKVTDKKMKRALQMYDTYLLWEAAKIKKSKETTK